MTSKTVLTLTQQVLPLPLLGLPEAPITAARCGVGMAGTAGTHPRPGLMDQHVACQMCYDMDVIVMNAAHDDDGCNPYDDIHLHTDLHQS